MNWTASTTTSWIHFNGQSSITFSDSAATEITIDKAESPEDSSDGSIIIITEDGETIIKNIKRCLPETCKYSQREYYGTYDVEIDKCDESVTTFVTYNDIAPGREESECPVKSGTTEYTFIHGSGTNESNTERVFTVVISGMTFNIKQGAGPCHGCVEVSKTYRYDDVTIDCISAETLTISCTYDCTTIYSNCEGRIERGETIITLSDISCNDGEPRTISGYEENVTGSTLAAAHPKITQNGDCQCEQPDICEGKTITVTPSKSSIDCSGETITFTATVTNN